MKPDTSPMEKTGILPGPTALSGLAVALFSYVSVKIINFLVVNSFNYELELWQNTLLFVFISSLLSVPFQLPKWWPFIFIIFSLIFMSIHDHYIPLWIFPTLILLLAALNWNSFGDRVPLYLSNQQTVDALSLMIDKSIKGTVYDLGCGLGSAVIPLAELHPNRYFVGVETAPLPWLIAKLRVRMKGLDNIKIKRQSMWDCQIVDAAFVYIFLSPHPMNKIINKCNNELKSGACIVSNSFDSEESPAPEMIQIYDRRQTKLLIWEI